MPRPYLEHCPCGSEQPAQIAYDGRGIPLGYMCKVCRARKLKTYRPEILRPYTQLDVDEPIEEDC